MGYRSTNTIIVTSAPVEVGPQAPEYGTVGIGLFTRGIPTKIVAVGGRCNVGLVGSNSTSRRVAQTGVAAWGLSGRSTPTTVITSGSFTHVTITRDYELATGEAPVGVVYFTPSAWLLNNAVTIVPAARPAALGSEGEIRIDLAANNDASTVPSGSYYTVREEIIGQPRRSYKVIVPYNVGNSVDLSTLPVIP